MSDYRPIRKGTRHYKIAQELLKIINQIDKQGDDHPWFHVPHIEIEHAIEGVRTNGTQRLTSILDVFFSHCQFDGRSNNDGLNMLEKSMRRNIAYSRKTLELIEQAREAFRKQYDLCPFCKGKHGKMGDRRDWQDCVDCNGLGFIEKRKSKLAGKQR